MLLLLPSTALLEPAAFLKTAQMMAANPLFFWWLLVNSCMAYAVNLTNFMVTKYTSALTLQVGVRLMCHHSSCVSQWEGVGGVSRSDSKPNQDGTPRKISQPTLLPHPRSWAT